MSMTTLRQFFSFKDLQSPLWRRALIYFLKIINDNIKHPKAILFS